MAKEVHVHNDGGGSGMGAMLGIVLGALLVIGGIFWFLNNNNATVVSVPSLPTTGQGAR